MFLAIFDKKKCIIDKRVKKVTYLLKIFNFDTFKVMKTCPVIRFLGTFFARALGFFFGNFAVPTFIRELPPPLLLGARHEIEKPTKPHKVIFRCSL